MSDAWRTNREPGWYRDLGYALQDVVRGHRYDYSSSGSRPGDPGWHPCSCGAWEGYWSDFEPHVADHLRDTALTHQSTAPDEDRDARAALLADVSDLVDRYRLAARATFGTTPTLEAAGVRDDLHTILTRHQPPVRGGITPGGNPVCPACGRWHGPGEHHPCPANQSTVDDVTALQQVLDDTAGDPGQLAARVAAAGWVGPRALEASRREAADQARTRERHRIADDLRASFRAWDALGGTRAPHPTHTPAWMVERAYDDAIRIALGADEANVGR